MPKDMSGFQERTRRHARGLPRYTPGEVIGRRAAAKRHAGRRRARLAEIKLAMGCVDCGYAAHPAALEFDHLPGADKIDEVGRLARSAAWDVVLAEIAKCELVCANCHRVRTAERLPHTGELAG